MPDPTTAPSTRSTTALDLELAAVYFPILAELARDKRTIGHGDLIERAKALHPQRKSVQKVISASLGRRLDVIRSFCQAKDLPDLSALVVDGATDEAVDGNADPIEVRRQVFSFDWSTVSDEFTALVREGVTSPAAKAKINEKQAIQLMWDHYKSNMTSIPKSVSTSRAQIITDIMAGVSAEDAFSRAVLAQPVSAPVKKKRSER